jgi:hypothetical protein
LNVSNETALTHTYIHTQAYANIRGTFYNNRHSMDHLRLLIDILNGMEYHAKCGKFIERMVDQDQKKFPGKKRERARARLCMYIYMCLSVYV